MYCFFASHAFVVSAIFRATRGAAQDMGTQPQTGAATSYPTINRKKQNDCCSDAMHEAKKKNPNPIWTQPPKHHYAMQTSRMPIDLYRLFLFSRLQGLLWRRVENAGGIDQSSMRVQFETKARTIESFDVEIAL
jgi:hypothetical protein